MKRFLTIILSVLLIAAIIFAVHSCKKEETPEVVQPDPNNPAQGLIEYDPVDDPNTEEDEGKKSETDEKDSSPVFTGVGIYHGRVDTNFVEITLDSIHPLLLSFKLSPELAKNFSSLNLEEESIISFEYQIINDQYVINKIIK